MASNYVFQPALELDVDQEEEPEKLELPVLDSKNQRVFRGISEEQAAPDVPEAAAFEPEQAPAAEPERENFARVQAEAILRDAREEAEGLKAQLRAEVAEELEAERRTAKEEGYSRGYAEGMAKAMQDGRQERERLAAEQVRAVETFLENAVRERDRVLDSAREELKDLAVAVAEKIIKVSLKNSSDIILRMVDSATDTHRRCEWAHIYVADCDVGGKAYTVPELTAALSHIADRVRVVPMQDEESGACIVEMPDVILDASVSTQLDNIREVLKGAVLEND